MSERSLEGKVALVTGAAQGAGRGIALAMAAAGAVVAGVDLQPVADVDLDLRCDVAEGGQIAATVARVVEELGTVDVLVNVAQSMVRSGPLLTMDEAEIDLLWRTGPLATMRFMRACHPHLCGGGAIINFGSGAQMNPQGYGVYAAVKEAIRSITRTAAVEWGPDGIRANLIAPFVVSPSMEADLGDGERRAASLARVPLGRFAQPSDIGDVAVFLAGPAAAMVTGQLLMVDGGSTYHR